MTRFSSVWPKLNKQDDIEAYIEQVKARDFDLCRADVSEVVCLTCDEWDDFVHNLLKNRDWLAGKGGCSSRGVREVIQVVRPGETAEESQSIFVDPQGYDYARYVGFYITDTQPRTVTNPPGLPTLEQAMQTTLNGKTMVDRILFDVPPNNFRITPAALCCA